MKKAILNKDNKSEIINRITTLQPVSTANWGSMTVNEMMFHCATINETILQGKQNTNKPTLKQIIIRTIALKIMKQLPKGIKTNPKYLRQKENDTEFEQQKKHLVSSINKVADHKEEIYGNHPFFGPMNTTKWRRFIYMHLDHHLRQFGA